MNWTPLLECKEESFFRGVVFRFPAEHPFEEIVDFMIIENMGSPTNFKLICSTGYHAGQSELNFPEEAIHKDGGISVPWLKDNWEKWIYPNCSVSDVNYIDNYPSNYG